VYAMTKGAINVMTRSLALTQGRRGITVNTVSPGITATEMNGWLIESPEAQQRVAAMTALGRHGQPADIADAVAFFASRDGRWVSGQTLEVNGGLFLGPMGER
jgi:3-oxoacyl-[acyl-carrier protein] reductase